MGLKHLDLTLDLRWSTAAGELDTRRINDGGVAILVVEQGDEALQLNEEEWFCTAGLHGLFTMKVY